MRLIVSQKNERIFKCSIVSIARRNIEH